MEVIVVRDPAQKEQVLRIRREVFVEEQRVPAELEVDEWDDDPRTVHVLAVDGGEAVAAGRMIPYDDEAAKIGRIAVLRSHRNRGIGRLVMETLEAVARERSWRALVLDAQCHARGFYNGWDTGPSAESSSTPGSSTFG